MGSWFEMSGDPEYLPQPGRVVAIVIVRFAGGVDERMLGVG
jgi:hypothetical protein